MENKLINLEYYTGVDLGQENSGAKSHILGIVEGLRKYGFNVTLISSSLIDNSNIIEKHIVIRKKNYRLHNQLFEQLRLVKIFLFKKSIPDVVYVRFALTYIVPAIYAFLKKIPFFLEINAVAEKESSHPFLLKFAKMVEIFILKQSSGIFVVSKELKDYLVGRKIPPNLVHVIPNACERHLIEKAIEKQSISKNRVRDSFTLGWLGTFQKRQGIPILLQAVNILKDDMPHIKLILAGDGAEKNYCEKLVEELNIEKFVSFEGYVDPDYIFEFMDKCDLAVAPYVGDLSVEAKISPLKVFTYLGCGKISIVSDLSIFALFNRCKSVKCFKDGDAKDLANRIRQISSLSMEERTILEKEAVSFIERDYTWDHVAENTGNVIKRRLYADI
jgi:glycosyltransferase involved in cell wall biosynthesis